jgi:hypothetical protein
MNNYRPLTENEISQLTARQCRCTDWTLIQVDSEFCADSFFDVQFSGTIRLGCFNHTFTLQNGIQQRAGIYHAHVHNCTVANNVYMGNIHCYIANYDIESEAYIENVDCLSVEGESCFGNGTKLALLDETGSRELVIFDELSAQLAYILTLWRHQPKAIEQINNFIQEYTNRKKSAQGHIGQQAHITNCGTIKNVFVGNNASINGASLLQNGSINSRAQAPVTVGAQVIANDFILASGVTLTDAAQIERCFVGQGSILSKQFSATDSVFFANCQGFHGEAVSVFAGPYTVTHHKSTLLIGGLFSFFNAGSGSNQSNHMYKLGPIHYGIVDRGTKMASDSYIPWPSRIGAFSLIMGKHKNKVDTSRLPFSYLIADNNETIIIPGISLLSIGTYRDVSKWPARDNRKDEVKTDIVSYPLFSPYTMQKIIQGKHLLVELLESKESTDTFIYFSDKIKIKANAVERGIKLYQSAINLYVGEIIFKKLQKEESLKGDEIAYAEWMDLAGFITPREPVNELLAKIERKEITSLAEINVRLTQLQHNYERDEWNYVLSILPEASHVTSNRKEELIAFLSNKWIQAKDDLIKQLTNDARKEFADPVKVVFGIDQNEENKQAEFEQIRGCVDDNSFIKHLVKRHEKRIEFIKRLKA